MTNLASAIAAGNFKRRTFVGLELCDGTLHIRHVVEERLQKGPGGNRAECSDNHEDEPGLIVPFAAMIAGDAGLAAQAHLAFEKIIDFAAVGVVAGNADETG